MSMPDSAGPLLEEFRQRLGIVLAGLNRDAVDAGLAQYPGKVGFLGCDLVMKGGLP